MTTIDYSTPPPPHVLDVHDHWDKLALRTLAGLAPGWITEDEVSWMVFNAASVLRGRTRKVVTALAEVGVLEALPVRHRGGWTKVYNLDPEAISSYLEESQ